MEALVHRAHVITVSDGVSAGTRTDTSGPALLDLLKHARFEVSGPEIVPDDQARINDAIVAAVVDGADVVVTTGGTGLGPRDVTPQATSRLIDYEVPGLAELMRRAGASSTPMAALSRGVAVYADGVVAAGAGKAQRLLRGKVRVEHRSGLAPRREAAVGQHEPVGEALAIPWDAGALGRGHDLEAGLAHDADAVALRHSRQCVGDIRVALAAVIQGAVRLDVRDRDDRGKARHLECDQSLDLGG
ncbi:MAG: MogA/MoaB family molybdenum cofactor biosynthesis protein [Chloroflexi bacterium]|nr:MAG: MogA/MoaB family molybdenum cofactor biosynthesis protein [Chloroflexota bacterium]